MSEDNPINNVPPAQPGTVYQAPADQEVTPQARSQQYSNPFAGQPFLNQPVSGETVQGQGTTQLLTPTPGQPVTHVDAKSPKTRTTKRLIIVIVSLLVLILILSVAYIFAIYIPNRPQNVWRTSFTRSNKAITMITNSLSESASVEALKKSEVNAVLLATAGDVTYSGEVGIKYDATSATGDIKVAQKNVGQNEKVFTTKFVSQTKDAAQFPSIYLQFAGLRSVGLDDFLPELYKYESKWIVLDETYLKSIGLTPQATKEAQAKQVTSAEVSKLAGEVVRVTGDYIFTNNPQKAVIEQRRFVAKEKVDGKTAYHYIVAINKQHAKDYCTELANSVVQTEAYKKLIGETKTDQKESLSKSCHARVDEAIKDTDTFDMWVEAKYKLIYKFRFTDEKDSNKYIELGQNYNGGSTISFFVLNHNGTDKMDAKFAMEANLKTYISKAVLTVVSQGMSPYNAKLTLEAKPYTGDVKVDTPAGAVSINEVFQALNIDPKARTSLQQRNTVDNERAQDIRALHGQIEVYYATNGRYPTLSNLNDAKWLKANMPGLDSAALKDPESSSPLFVTTPTPQRYAYLVVTNDNETCDNIKKTCMSYTLTAIYSDGKTYVKQNLN